MSTYILIMVLASNFGFGNIHSIQMNSKATCEAAAKQFQEVAIGNSTVFCVEK